MDHDNQAKRDQLRKHGAWNDRAETVTNSLFCESEFFDPRDLVLVKYEMLRCVRIDPKPVAESARQFGFSRSGYYKVLSSFQQSGLAGLIPSAPGPRGAHKLRDDVLNFIEARLAEDRTLTSSQLATLLLEQHQLRVHPRSIERAIARREKKGR